jgi:pyridoxal phosphate enzyme (YggS family)
MFRERLAEVEARIRRAVMRAGRRRDEITLIGVTKLFPASVGREAYALGVRHFGENYVQEFEGKLPELGELAGAQFHLIGHLQSNKAKRAAQLFDVIETVDSAKLARRLEEVPPELRRSSGSPLEVMIEVRLSAEETKSGVSPEELPAVLEAVRSCPSLHLTGLMTMPPFSDDPEQSRPYFRRLRELAERFGLAKLSMGMSHDLEVAVEEGATHLRVGTALFGPRREQ